MVVKVLVHHIEGVIAQQNKQINQEKKNYKNKVSYIEN